jgi:predicted secreted hydrolase
VKRREFLAIPLLLLAPPLRADASYPTVVPGRALSFPRDFGSHPEFRTEWWYITGWLKDGGGADLGMQITFFRNRPGIAEDNPSQFAPRQLLFAHAALSEPRHGRLRRTERASRAGFGLAEAKEETTGVWIDDWSLRRDGERYLARIAADEFAFDFVFSATQPVLLEGVAGYSQKAPDPAQASYYYSEPQLGVSGTLTVDGRAQPVTGRAWLDHEFSSESLPADAAGWDWVGINFDDGSALMAFRIRDQAGGVRWAGGSLRERDGSTRVYRPEEVRFSPLATWRSPRTKVTYPTRMLLQLPDREIDFVPLMADQEFDSRGSTGTIYWEGAVRAMRNGKEAGRGYLELTGYWKPLKL